MERVYKKRIADSLFIAQVSRKGGCAHRRCQMVWEDNYGRTDCQEQNIRPSAESDMRQADGFLKNMMI